MQPSPNLSSRLLRTPLVLGWPPTKHAGIFCEAPSSISATCLYRGRVDVSFQKSRTGLDFVWAFPMSDFAPSMVRGVELHGALRNDAGYDISCPPRAMFRRKMRQRCGPPPANDVIS